MQARAKRNRRGGNCCAPPVSHVLHDPTAIESKPGIARLCLWSTSFFDLDHLATAVGTASRANVMRTFLRLAVLAIDQIQRGDEMMTAAITLPCAADPLLGKCTHG
jgi:hypothetical protein